jgi:hypothetical protein
MPVDYRDERDALRGRVDNLEQELDEARSTRAQSEERGRCRGCVDFVRRVEEN